MIGTKAMLRTRMAARDAHYGGELVDGARILALFGDLATELLIRLDGDEGLFRSYESVEFLAPVFTGDFIEATAEIVEIGSISRRIKFEASKVITNLRQVGVPPSAADVLAEPVTVCRAIGTCVTPKDLQRRPRELYMPQLPPGAPPGPEPIVTPPETVETGARSLQAEPLAAEVVLTALLASADPRQPGALASAHELVDRAARCREAGAAVIQLEIPRGRPSAHDPERLVDLIERIRTRTDCIIQLSAAPRDGDAPGSSFAMDGSEDDRAELLALAPEIATLECGSVNSGDGAIVATRPALRAAGAVPDLQCYEVGHVEEALALADGGLVDRPLRFQLVLGMPGAMRATEANLRHLVNLVPRREATWSLTTLGPGAEEMTELAIRLGGHARVGFEGDPIAAVARAAAHARSVGRAPADPSRARRLLGTRPLR
jgi:3-keto-5-aminohexanoate cleavage enzyme